MRLIFDWRHVLKRAWSVRLMVIASFLIILEPVVGLLADLSTGWGFAVSLALNILSGLAALAAIWARVIAQKDFKNGT